MPGLIYAELEGGLISIIVPDDEKELDAVKLQPGEVMLVISPKEYQQATDLQAVINAATGKIPPSPRVAVVQKATGVVVDAILAYPSVFSVKAEFVLVQNPDARKGDRFVNGDIASGKIERIEAEKAAQSAEVSVT